MAEQDLQDILNFDVSAWGLDNMSSSSSEEVVIFSREKLNCESSLETNNLSDFLFRQPILANQSFLNETESMKLPNDMVFGAGHLISVITYSFLFVFSLMGNATVLFVIVQRRKKTSPFSRIDLMLLHLCVADLIVTFFMMPLEVAWAITVTWRGGDFLCRVMAFFRILGLYLSSFVLVCLAMDRYLAVAHPMHSLGSGKRGKIMLTCAWTLSVLCSLPQIYIFHVESHPDFPWYKQCVTFGSLPESYDLAYRIFCMLMMYALPFATILLLYCGIVFELYQRTREASLSNFPEGLRRSGLGNLGRAREKTLKMTVAIVAVFFVCWTPYYVMCLWYMIDANSAKFVDQRIQRALFLFACTNSTANPIVYGIFHLKSTFTTQELRTPNHSGSSFRRTNTIQTPPKTQVANGHAVSIHTYPRPAIITTTKSSSRRSKSTSVKFTEKNQSSTKRLVSWNPRDASFC